MDFTLLTHSLLEEPPASAHVAVRGEKKNDGLSFLVDGTCASRPAAMCSRTTSSSVNARPHPLSPLTRAGRRVSRRAMWPGDGRCDCRTNPLRRLTPQHGHTTAKVVRAAVCMHTPSSRRAAVGWRAARAPRQFVRRKGPRPGTLHTPSCPNRIRRTLHFLPSPMPQSPGVIPSTQAALGRTNFWLCGVRPAWLVWLRT